MDKIKTMVYLETYKKAQKAVERNKSWLIRIGMPLDNAIENQVKYYFEKINCSFEQDYYNLVKSL